MPLFWQIVQTVWRARVLYFWPIWITITVAAAIVVAWMVGRKSTQACEKAEGVPTDLEQTRRRVWSSEAIVALISLGMVLVCYIVVNLRWEDFAYSDNDMLTLITLKGHDITPPIWKGEGRFFPLGHQEFNLIRHFTNTVVGYHALPIIQLPIMCCILLILMDNLSVTTRAAIAAFVLISPAIVVSFGGLIFPERNVVFWLVCLALCVKRFEQTHIAGWAVAAVVCAQFMIYYKETAFILLVGFSVGRLILRCRKADRAGWNYSRLRDTESRLDLCLTGSGVMFLLYYLVAMLPHPSMKYADKMQQPIVEVILSYIKLDLLAWLFVGVVLYRTYLIRCRKVTPSLLWDGLAFGGVACFASYLCLHMFSDYFMAPVDVIAVLYLGRLAILSWAKTPLWGKVVGWSFLLLILFQDISLSAFAVYERKNIIHAKAEIARVVEARYQSGTGNVQRVFFPFASPYRVMEFASYLNYKGVPVKGATVDSTELKSVVLVSRSVAKNGPCVEWRTLECQTGSSPDPADLVILLPDDDAALTEITPYLAHSDLLLSYEPHPRIPLWFYACVRRRHIASTPFPLKELPAYWLHGSVTLWK